MAQLGLILSVAGGAAKLSIALYSIAAAIGTAGVEVRTFASNASSLAQVLTSLSNALETKEPVSPGAKTIADDLITLCQTILDDSNKLLKKLRPLVELTDNAQKRFILRIIWIFEKSKFATHVQSLETLKGTLSLLIGTVNYSQVVALNRSRDIQISLRVQLQSIASEVQNGNRGHQTVSRLMQRGSRVLTQNSLEAPQGSQPLKFQRILNGSVDGEKEATNTLALEPSKIEKSLVVHSKDVEDEEEAEEEVEREFGIEGLDVLTLYLQISLLQQRTIQFATLVLQAEDDGATAEDTTTPNDQRPSNYQDRNRNNSPLSPGQPEPRLNVGHINGNIFYNSENRESLDRQQGVSSSEATSAIVANTPATTATEAEVINVMQPISFGILKFTDAHGRKYDLALNDCRTWEGISSVLREIYKGGKYWERYQESEVEKRDNSDSKLSLRPFVLLGGPEYSIILPRHWARIVHSGYSVTMRFHSLYLNGVPDPRIDPRIEGSQRLVGKVGFWGKLVKMRRDAV